MVNEILFLMLKIKYGKLDRNCTFKLYDMLKNNN